MSTPMTPRMVANWRRTITLLFVFMGASQISIMTRMPLVKQDLRVTATQLGLILLASGIGSLVSLNIVGLLIARWGTRVWIRAGYVVYGSAVLVGSWLIQGHQTATYVVVAVVSGFVIGIVDVAVNVDGTAVEQATGKTLMPRMHAGYSLGTLIGSAWGSLGAALHWNLFAMALPLCVIQIALPFTVAKYLPHGTGIEERRKADDKAKAPTHWFSFVLVLLGLGILCMTLAEGAANDWLTLGVKQGFGVTDSQAGLVFTVLFASMVLVRYFGGHLADRFGKGRALQLLAGIGVIGVLLIALPSQNVLLACIGAAMWGAGVSLGFPLFLSAAGEGENAAKKVSFVASWGYGAFLAGPPLLGFVADQITLQRMFFVIAGFLALALAVAGAAGQGQRSTKP